MLVCFFLLYYFYFICDQYTFLQLNLFQRCKNLMSYNSNWLQVMCDAYTAAGEPIPTNKRHNAAKIFSYPDVVAEEPWYGIYCCFLVVSNDLLL